MNKRSVKIFMLAVALCGLLVSILSCENPVGGIENSPVSDFVGKTYKNQWESFSVTKDGDNVKIILDYTQGIIVETEKTSVGTVYLLECCNHSNYSPAQYPGYNEINPHSGCYTLIHIRSISGESVEWAQFATKIGAQGEGEFGTTCFASSEKSKAQEYLDFSKWDPPIGYSTGTVVK